ncbi:LytTR family DNA-binding domain-containing protein [Spirosoma sp. RP8]|uniref:LytTR family DNA-binding domain-containing protein n=1 Tax=Spirosoma liriopis TaxID=2937440 RepID=A0ABT0HU70_9BACT|nr:LytTR family DNA-binding domain-containing protein [Spirosoma liriopis]
MKVINYIIIDDTESDVANLKENLMNYPFLNLIQVCTTLDEALTTLSTEDVGLIFMETSLGGTPTFPLLKQNLPLPPVIVLSSSHQLAVESYEIGVAADYILKPVTLQRLLLAINRALAQQLTRTSFQQLDYIFLKMGRKIQRFDFQAIDYIEAYGIYSKVVYHNQLFVVNERIAALSALLPARQFVRVHKSYIVNLSKITSYDRNFFHIDAEKIPIGVSFRPKLEGLLRLFESS